MEQRLANTFTMTVNEKKFIETGLISDLCVDGRNPFDYRKLTIKFGRDPYSKGVDFDELKASLASRVARTPSKNTEETRKKLLNETERSKKQSDINPASSPTSVSVETGLQGIGEKSLKDAVKPSREKRRVPQT